MLPMRKKYQEARAQAGEGFVAENPGKHFFFGADGQKDPMPKLCVFCGHSEALLKSKADPGDEYAPCPGDVRTKSQEDRRAATAALLRRPSR